MTAAAPGKPARHMTCALRNHCPDCGWVVCKADQVVISRRLGVTLGNEIPHKETSR